MSSGFGGGSGGFGISTRDLEKFKKSLKKFRFEWEAKTRENASGKIIKRRSGNLYNSIYSGIEDSRPTRFRVFVGARAVNKKGFGYPAHLEFKSEGGKYAFVRPALFETIQTGNYMEIFGTALKDDYGKMMIKEMIKAGAQASGIPNMAIIHVGGLTIGQRLSGSAFPKGT
jgi:hypothetical protein